MFINLPAIAVHHTRAKLFYTIESAQAYADFISAGYDCTCIVDHPLDSSGAYRVAVWRWGGVDQPIQLLAGYIK